MEPCQDVHVRVNTNIQMWLLSSRWDLPCLVYVCEIVCNPGNRKKKKVEEGAKAGKKRRETCFWCFNI